MKKFILGFLLGALMFGFISVAATATHNIIPNPFRILVDGEKRVVEAYLINDRTFLQLRGVGYLFDGVEIDFVDGVIIIETDNATDANRELQREYARQRQQEHQQHIAGANNNIDTTNYITVRELGDKLEGSSFWLVFCPDNINLMLMDGFGGDAVVVIEDIPFEVFNDRTHIPRSFIDSHMQPFLTN